MVKGGFHRKLSAAQVILYRDNWLSKVAQKRGTAAVGNSGSRTQEVVTTELAAATNLLEVFREGNQLELIALVYNAIGVQNLRDDYIEKAIKADPTNITTLVTLRCLQGRQDLIPSSQLNSLVRSMKRGRYWNDLARLYYDLGNKRKSIEYYLKTISTSLEKDNIFGAAYYLREMMRRNFDSALFEEALDKAVKKGELWLQIRALEELGREQEIRQLVIRYSKNIDASKDLALKMKKAKVLGDEKSFLRYQNAYLKELSKEGITSMNCNIHGHLARDSEKVR